MVIQCFKVCEAVFSLVSLYFTRESEALLNRYTGAYLMSQKYLLFTSIVLLSFHLSCCFVILLQAQSLMMFTIPMSHFGIIFSSLIVPWGVGFSADIGIGPGSE